MTTAEINIDFGNRVRSQREYCGLSQLRLGNKIGVSQGYISKMETRGWVPSKEIVDKLTKVLDTNTDYLFNKKPVEPKKEEKIDAISPINNFVAKNKLTEGDISSIKNPEVKNKLMEDFENLFNKKQVEPKKEEKIDAISSIKNPEVKNKLMEDFEKEDLDDSIEDPLTRIDPEEPEFVKRIQKNLNYLFTKSGDQYYVSSKTTLYDLANIARKCNVTVEYLIQDHEADILKEQIESKYKEIEEMEDKLADLESKE